MQQIKIHRNVKYYKNTKILSVITIREYNLNYLFKKKKDQVGAHRKPNYILYTRDSSKTEG